jgi:hypothetical protein
VSIDVIEVNAATGEIEERAFTDSEKEILSIIVAEEKARQALVAEREAAKTSALAKLEALGLTADEAQAIAGI